MAMLDRSFTKTPGTSNNKRLNDNMDNVTPSCANGRVRSPMKKMRKWGSPDETPVLKHGSFRRIIADSQYDLGAHSGRETAHVPCYKQKTFVDSPAKEDPYSLSETPDKPRKLLRTKASSNLFGNLSQKSPKFDVTPEMPKDHAKRRPPSSPHPGKDKFSRGKNSPSLTSPLVSPTHFSIDYEEEVPLVGFNSLTSPLHRMAKSSKSCANILKTPSSTTVTTPVRTPMGLGSLRSSGVSTSSLRIRQPVIVDLDEQCNTTLSSFSSSSQLQTPSRRTSRSTVSTPLSVLPESPQPSILSRKRSTSVGSLSKTLQEEITPSSRNLRVTPERTRCRSLERSRSVDRLNIESDNLRSMSLRNTPERTRYISRDSSQERGLKKFTSNLERMMRTVSASSITERNPKQFEVTLVEDAPKVLSQPQIEEKQPSQYVTAPNTPAKNDQLSQDTYSSFVPDSQESDVVMDSQEIPSSPVSQELPALDIALVGSILRPSNKEKNERRIRFDKLNVYYFSRAQGFDVVPKHGEIALGMKYRHFATRQFNVLQTKRPKIDYDDSEDSELSDGEEPGYKWQSFFEKPQVERIKILEAAGVQIDKQKGLQLIRQSRSHCGCSCRGGVCKPASCECNRLGIGCQVDGPRDDGSTYPCVCYNKDLCSNEHGRIAYDFNKVSESRKATIQRYQVGLRTGIFGSPVVKKFDNAEEVADSQETHTNMEINHNSATEADKETTNSSPESSQGCSFFPPSQSLL